MRRHVEDSIQLAVAQHIRARGVPGLVAFHVPNGGRRNAREAARLKGMGVLAGVSDWILVYGGKVFALELKAPGGRASESQMAFIANMEAQGAFTCIAEGLDRAIATLESWCLLRGAAA